MSLFPGKTIDKILIGPFAFKVFQEHNLRDGNRELNGWIQFNSKRILLEEGLNPQEAHLTLWHEILHGILNNAGHQEVNDSLLDALSAGIIGVLLENPELRDMDYRDWEWEKEE